MWWASVLMCLLAIGCDRPDSEGPSLDELFGQFEVLDSLSLTTHTPDFSVGTLLDLRANSPSPSIGHCVSWGRNQGVSKPCPDFQGNFCLNKWCGTATAMTFLFHGPNPARLSLQWKGSLRCSSKTW